MGSSIENYESLCAGLTSDFEGLDARLCTLKQQYVQLKEDYIQQCTQALGAATNSLQSLVASVEKADSTLVNWYNTSRVAKLSLRLMGCETRMTMIVEGETRNVKAQVTMLQCQFEKSELMVKQGLSATQELNKAATHFSQSEVASAQRRTDKAHSDITVEQTSVQYELEKVQGDYKRTKDEADAIPQRIATAEALLETRRGQHERESIAAGSVAAVSVVSGIAGFVFPPAFIVSGLAAASSIGTGIAAGVHDSDVDKLKERTNSLQSDMARLKERMDTLSQKDIELVGRRTRLGSTKQAMSSLQQRGEFLRMESNTVMLEHLRLRVLFSSLSMKLHDINSKLSGTEYMDTRREISNMLQEVVCEVQGSGIPDQIGSHDSVKAILERINAIDQQTEFITKALQE